MDSILDVQFMADILHKISEWFLGHVLILGNVVQVAIVLVLMLLGNLS